MRQSIQTKHLVVLSAVLAALCVGAPGSARASTDLLAGWDLFRTETAYFNFGGAMGLNIEAFEGDPLGTFDFGSGAVDVGLTDTIVHRIDAADLTLGGACGLNCDTIDIELVALSLVSVTQYDIGNGMEYLFATLNTDLGDSEMDIFDTGHGDPHGTFDSYLHFTVDISASISGYLGTFEKEFDSEGNRWRHDPFDPRIDGVNHLLNTTDTNNDFWLKGDAFHDAGGGTTHTVSPEPGTGLLVGFGLIGLGLAGRRKLAA